MKKVIINLGKVSCKMGGNKVWIYSNHGH